MRLRKERVYGIILLILAIITPADTAGGAKLFFGFMALLFLFPPITKKSLIYKIAKSFVNLVEN